MPPYHVFLRSNLILLSRLCLGQVVSFNQLSPPNACMHMYWLPCVLHTLHIALVLLLSPEYYLVRSTDLNPSFIVFSTNLLPRPSCARISSSATYCRTSAAYAPPLVLQTKYRNHKNNRQNYSSVYLNIYIFGEQTGRQTVCIRWQNASLISICS
jgi:hypothetical protein